MKNAAINAGNALAFPTVESQYSHEEGVTLRDYFAAKAMQSLIKSSGDHTRLSAMCVADASYMYANAMLEEKEKYFYGATLERINKQLNIKS